MTRAPPMEVLKGRTQGRTKSQWQTFHRGMTQGSANVRVMKGNVWTTKTCRIPIKASIEEAAREPGGRIAHLSSAPGTWTCVLFRVRVPPSAAASFQICGIFEGGVLFTLARCLPRLPGGYNAPKRPIVAQDRGQPWTMGPLGHNIKPFLHPSDRPFGHLTL